MLEAIFTMADDDIEKEASYFLGDSILSLERTIVDTPMSTLRNDVGTQERRIILTNLRSESKYTMIIIETSTGYILFQQWAERPQHALEEERNHEWVLQKEGDIWGKESLMQSVSRRNKVTEKYKPTGGYFQSFAQCLWRLLETSSETNRPEPLPVHLSKDESQLDERIKFQPEDCQIMTGKTALAAHHEMTQQEAYQQAYSTITLICRSLHGDRVGFPHGVQPYLIQVPKAARDDTRETSEKISILIEVPSFSVKLTLLVKEVTKGEFKGMEFIDIKVQTDSKLPLSEGHLWVSWERVMLEIPALINKIKAGNSYVPRVPHPEPLDPSLLLRIQSLSIHPRTKITARKSHKAKHDMKQKMVLHRRKSLRKKNKHNK